MSQKVEPSAEEIGRLQRCISDLIGVVALPTMWSGGDPEQVARTLLETLEGVLQLDFAFLRLTNPPSELLRTSALTPEQVRAIVARSLDDTPNAVCRAELSSGRDISAISVHLGLHGEFGVLIVGSQRFEFPQQTERLLLNVAANQAAIGLQEARRFGEQKRIARELDDKVAQRTRELADANEALRHEIEDRKEIEARLLESKEQQYHVRVELQKALDEIRKSEAKLHQVIDTIPTLAWCNLPDGPNEFLSKRWHEYTGLSPEESHGWGWQTAFHPEDLPALMKKWMELIETGEPDEIESRLRRYDGVYRWFLIRVEPFRDETGTIVRWYGTSTDIEERKQAEERSRRSEAFLAEGLNLARVGNFSWLVETDDIKWSDQLYQIFEFEPGQPITFEKIGSRVHPDDVHTLYNMIEKAQRNVSDFEYEHRLLMPDGSVKYLRLVAHAGRNSEHQVEYIGAVQDVTQRHLADDALARARSQLANVSRVTSLGVLTASIAHEVNQPLSGIITNASTCLRMLSAEPPNVEGARETALRTIRDGNRAADVISRLRTLFTRKDRSAEAVDLNDATKEVIALALNELHRGKVVLRPELGDDLPPVIGDRVQLQQVIMNLMRNASDAMSTIHDRPRDLLIRTESDGEAVRLSVTDSGVGFDAQSADRLFEAFYTTKNDGMGIGLSISRSIIEAHQGRLWATPNQGPGATFCFSLPCSTDTKVQ
ncbi:PAS/PAC sensor signal transduction histidine kinase [Candidatus Koribacter versatilis Ellin345]|uniref:histidine kinase n=2 Tax=Candidatus Korobacter versatilis TaxID=658062 RepID=Q1ITF2_KORVE|nr:PAS/PAC sensor signal transduction histidine kinase [Candidatus Koribacter versatilis Ellin345]